MSLIHQVLQDIDNRESQTGLAESEYAAEKSRSGNGGLWLVSAGVAGALVFAVARPDLVNLNTLFGGGKPSFFDNELEIQQAQTANKPEPLAAIESTLFGSEPEERTLPPTPTPVAVDLSYRESSAVTPDKRTEDSIQTAGDASAEILAVQAADRKVTQSVTRPVSAQASQPVKQPVLSAVSSPVLSPANSSPVTSGSASVSSASKSQALSSKTSSSARVSVIQNSNAPSDHYKKALASYKAGDYNNTLRLLNQALIRSSAPEYLTLKARVYIDQGNIDQFLDIYRTNSNLDDPDWLKVVAPGLHIFRLYPQAASQYEKLIRLYPSQVNWSMARFQALKDSGDYNAARTELNRMQSGYTLSADQQEWVSYQRRRMI